jgi:hypothetical protein
VNTTLFRAVAYPEEPSAKVLMPFTLCHPAMAIPLHRYTRRVTSLSALVIGSMAPDFVYYFSFGVSGEFSHSVLGILLYCVPAGALVTIVYYALLRQPFLAWLPQVVSARMSWQAPRPFGSARASLNVLVSLAIGAFTHIAWDAFTHRNTIAVERFELLHTLVSIGGHEMPLFKVLQHASSLFGFIVIAAYIGIWLSRSAPGPRHPVTFSNRQRLLALAAVVAAAAAGGLAGLLLRPAVSIEHGLFNVVVSSMATAALAIVFLCIGWKAYASKGN